MFIRVYYSGSNFRKIQIGFSVIYCHLKINVNLVHLIMFSGSAFFIIHCKLLD